MLVFPMILRKSCPYEVLWPLNDRSDLMGAKIHQKIERIKQG
jgi:hypothetical protein